MKSPILRNLTITGILAALYMCITLAIAPLSYGAVQIRLAEGLMLLPFLNKKILGRSSFRVCFSKYV